MCFLALALMVISQPTHPDSSVPTAVVPSGSDRLPVLAVVEFDAKHEEPVDEDLDAGHEEQLSILSHCTAAVNGPCVHFSALLP